MFQVFEVFGKCFFKQKNCKLYDEIRNWVFWVFSICWGTDEWKRWREGKGEQCMVSMLVESWAFPTCEGLGYSWHAIELNLGYLDCWKRSSISFAGLVCWMKPILLLLILMWLIVFWLLIRHHCLVQLQEFGGWRLA